MFCQFSNEASSVVPHHRMGEMSGVLNIDNKTKELLLVTPTTHTILSEKLSITINK